MLFGIIALSAFAALAVPCIIWLSRVTHEQHQAARRHDQEKQLLINHIRHEREMRVLADARCRGMIEIIRELRIDADTNGAHTNGQTGRELVVREATWA